jgi:hypothetical protein
MLVEISDFKEVEEEKQSNMMTQSAPEVKCD